MAGSVLFTLFVYDGGREIHGTARVAPSITQDNRKG